MLRVALCVTYALMMVGCAFSSYQTAKMLPQGATSVGVAANNYSYREDGQSVDDEALEVMASTGLSDQVEIGGKVAWFSEEGIDVINILLTPKIAITPNQLAFVAQTGFILIAEDDDSVDSNNVWMTMPGVVFTTDLVEPLTLDLTGKLVALFTDNFDDYNLAGAVNIGVRLAPKGAAWSVGPELGFMYDDDASGPGGDTGYFLQFGLGFHYQFGGTAQAAPGSALPPPPPPPSPGM